MCDSSIKITFSLFLMDEIDLTKVNFDMNLFEIFTKGFLESCGGALTETEIELLRF